LIDTHGDGFFDELETVLNDFGATTSLGVIKLGEGSGAGFLEDLEGGPFCEQSAGKRGKEIATNELEGLWVVVFESLGEFVGEAGADVDELAPFFDEGGELMGEWIWVVEGLKLEVSLEDELRDGMSITTVIFCAGGAEGLAVFFNDGGVYEVDRLLRGP